MSYYDSGTSAHRNSFYATGSEYNRMKMQAEMNAEAIARQNPSFDMQAFSRMQADNMTEAFSRALQEEREEQQRAAERARYEREMAIRRAEAREVQKDNIKTLDDIISGKTQVANVPENREEALAICQYIKDNNKYPAPWGNEVLTQNYRKLVQAFLDRADAHAIKGLTALCVNDWIARCRLLRIKAETQNVLDWRDDYEALVEIQQ